jgi:hypothetical protein
VPWFELGSKEAGLQSREVESCQSLYRVKIWKVGQWLDKSLIQFALGEIAFNKLSFLMVNNWMDIKVNK